MDKVLAGMIETRVDRYRKRLERKAAAGELKLRQYCPSWVPPEMKERFTELRQMVHDQKAIRSAALEILTQAKGELAQMKP